MSSPQPTGEPTFTTFPDRAAVAAAAAARVAELLAEHRSRTGRAATLSLTGGGVGIATAAALADLDCQWEGVHIVLGDERFVPRTDPERTSTQLHEALLTRCPGATFHDWPAPGDPGADTVDAAADTFRATYPMPADGTAFDIVVLGMGGEGHFNSVFPHSVACAPDAPPIMAVHNAPKPPPQRLTFTMSAVQRSTHIVVVTAGAEKAPAVAAAAHRAAPQLWPIAGVRGLVSTEFFVDVLAAQQL